jgi:hypothetical protein
MTQFFSVGRFKGLKGGIGSRGWQVWRKDRSVWVRWGPIEISRGYPKQFRWAAENQPKKYKFETTAAAKEFCRRRIKQKLTGKLGSRDGVYQSLPKGQRILRKSSSKRRVGKGA